MPRDPLDRRHASADAAMPWISGDKQRRGRRSYQSGLAAEDCAARCYAARGAKIVAHRTRTPHGEIDLIVQHEGLLVFVEVKKRARIDAWDSPISAKQWERLKNSALHYIFAERSTTDVQPIFRFDAALVGGDGTVQIIENARSFDEH